MLTFTNEHRRRKKNGELEGSRSLGAADHAEIIRQMNGTEKDAVMCDRITTHLEEQGIKKMGTQMNSKLKLLKRQYHQVVDHNT